jgi:hypothetical protein
MITFANLRSEVWSLVARLAAFKVKAESSYEMDCFRVELEANDHRERPDSQC